MGSRRRTYSHSPSHRQDSKKHVIGSEIEKINWDIEDLSKITKDIYIPSDSQLINDKQKLQKFLDENEISISDFPKLFPTVEFSEINFPECISEKIILQKWTKPFSLESTLWPLILAGNNVNIRAHTGAGKTVSLIFPMIMHTLANITNKKPGPTSLILVPTREISEHFEYILKNYTQDTRLTICSLSGGVSRSAQRDSIEAADPHILVSTPGRLLDFVESKYICIKNCSIFSIYETDRMLDMGFNSAMQSVSNLIRPDRQTLLFSTKKSAEFEKFSSRISTSPITVNVDHYRIITKQTNVKQSVEILTPAKKFDRLIYILKRIDKLQCFIFVENQRVAEFLKERLRDRNYYVGSIHVDKTPKERFTTLEKLRAGSFDVIISTESACRGLNINDISCYIYYDYPSNIDEYINLLSRISRSIAKVECINFFHSRNGTLAKDLIKVLDDCKQKVSNDLIRISKEGYQSNNRRRHQTLSKSRTRSPTPKKSRRRSHRSKSYSNSGSSKSRTRSSGSDRSFSLSSSKKSYRSSVSSIVNGNSSSHRSRGSSRSYSEDDSRELNNGTSIITKKTDLPSAKSESSRSTSPKKAKSRTHSKSLTPRKSRSDTKSSKKSSTSNRSFSKSRSSTSSRSVSYRRTSKKHNRSSSKSSRSGSRRRSTRRRSTTPFRSRSRSFQPSRYGYVSRKPSRSYSRRRRSPSPRRRFRPASKRYGRRNSPSSRRRTPSYRRRTPSYRRHTPSYHRRTPSYRRRTPSYRRRSPPRRRPRSPHPKSRRRSRSISSKTPSPSPPQYFRRRPSDHSSRSSSNKVVHEKLPSPIKQRSLSIPSNRSVSTSPSSHSSLKHDTSNKKSLNLKKLSKKHSVEDDDEEDISEGGEKKSEKSKKKKKKKSKKSKKSKKEKKAKKREALEDGAGDERVKSKKKKKKASS